MKTNRLKLFGIIALVAIIGVTFAACNKGGSASGGMVKANPESDFEVRAIDGGQGVEITRYVGTKQVVNIPPQIRQLPVTVIGQEAFFESLSVEKGLTSITIPNSVTTIEEMAFICNQLTNITIGANVKIIGVAFGNLGMNWDFMPVGISNGFQEAYNAASKVAGTYTRPNTGSTAWTKQ